MRLNGCHNLPREAKPLLVQDGWIDSGIRPDGTFYGHRELVRLPRMVLIPFINSLECRYDQQARDVGCTGCIHAKAAP